MLAGTRVEMEDMVADGVPLLAAAASADDDLERQQSSLPDPTPDLCNAERAIRMGEAVFCCGVAGELASRNWSVWGSWEGRLVSFGLRCSDTAVLWSCTGSARVVHGNLVRV